MIGLVIVLLSLGTVSGLGPYLRIYALPVGQGEALVFICPRRDITIVDMGSSQSSNSRFWNTNRINEFLKDKFAKVKNIIITHNDEDHYNLIPQVFDQANKLVALENIYISRTFDELPDDLKNWIEKFELEDEVRTINGGKEYCCTPNANQINSCYKIALCPGINADVLFANLGDGGTNKNRDSIVIRIAYGEFSVVLNGDFTDIPKKVYGKECVGKKEDLYKSMAGTTVYKLAHHGSSNDANKNQMLSVIKPKAIFVSANPWYGNLGHPRCSVIDFLKDNVKTLCKPNEQKETDQFYCGQHPYPNADILQEKYTCCDPRPKPQHIECKTKDNEYAIYSTTPDENTINLIELVTDGTRWGFINKIEPRENAGRRNLEPSPLLSRLMLGRWGSQ